MVLNNFDNDSNDTIDDNPTSTDMGARNIISNAALSDGTDYYIYLTARDGANAIKVFRQKD